MDCSFTTEENRVGVMRFRVHPADMLENTPDAKRAWIGGFDGRIFPTRVEFEDDTLVCRRQQSDSGKLYMPWRVAGFGTPIVHTAQLREREDAYFLPLELARGKLSEVRNQHATWEQAGMQIADQFLKESQQAHALFRKAIGSKDSPLECGRYANNAIASAFRAAELLTRSYTQQRLAIRHQRSKALPVSIGCGLGEQVPDEEFTKEYCQAFNAAVVPIEWNNIEPVEGEYNWDTIDAQVDWCQQNKLFTLGGPLLDFSPGGLPDWLKTWGDDILNMQSFVCDFVETAIERYIGRIRHWEVVARANVGGALGITEENRLALVARILEVARQVDEEIQLTIRVDQPWGDYQRRGDHRLSPLQFVDALVRSGVGLSDVNLEIAIGYKPDGTRPRDLHDFSRMLDRWSCLQIPINLTLAFPSIPDPCRNGNGKGLQWKSGFTEDAQAEWIDLFLPLIMAKDPVVGVYWANLSDASKHRFPSCGLLNETGKAKPALEQILKYRRAFWDVT